MDVQQDQGFGDLNGNGNFEEANWRPSLDAVANCVSAWSSRHLSYGAKGLISKALALVRVWYMASMLRIPGCARAELNRSISFWLVCFLFFFRGKVDLVSCAVVIQPRGCGGFGIVSAHLKSWALLLQWVKRFWASSHGWRLFFWYWTQAVFRASPVEVVASRFAST